MAENDIENDVADFAASELDKQEDDESSIFAGFPDSEDLDFSGGEDDSDSEEFEVFGEEDEDEPEPDVSPDDLDASDPEDDFDADIDEDAETVEDDDELDFLSDPEEEEDYEEEDEDSSGLDKGKAVFYGVVATVLVGIGAAGYFVLMPMLGIGASSQPPQQAQTQSAPPPAYSPDERPEPATIPGSSQQAQSSSSQSNGSPEGLPPSGGERVQVPGMPTNVEQDNIRPTVEGNDVPMPSNEQQMSIPDWSEASDESTGTPENDTGNSMPSLPMPNESSISDEAETSMPSTASESAPSYDETGDALGDVSTKIDTLIGRFDELDQKFVSEDDVQTIVDDAVANIDVSPGANAATAEAVSGLQQTVNDLRGQVESFGQRLSQNSPNNSAVEEIRNVMSSEMKALNQRLDAYESRLEDLNDAADSKKEEAPEQTSSKTDELEKTVARQEQEIEDLKTRGAGIVPPTRPRVYDKYRLAGLSSDTAWIDTPSGVLRFSRGDEIHGVGRITEFREMDGNYIVVTDNGIIVP